MVRHGCLIMELSSLCASDIKNAGFPKPEGHLRKPGYLQENGLFGSPAIFLKTRGFAPQPVTPLTLRDPTPSSWVWDAPTSRWVCLYRIPLRLSLLSYLIRPWGVKGAGFLAGRVLGRC